MTIELTDEQRRAVLQGQPVRLPMPEGDVMVISAAKFENVQEILDDEKQQHDEKQQRAFRQAGLRSAIRRMKENPY